MKKPMPANQGSPEEWRKKVFELAEKHGIKLYQKEWAFLCELISAERERCLKRVEREMIGEGEVQFLKKDRLEYEMGWCDGREQLRAEQRASLAKLKKEEL